MTLFGDKKLNILAQNLLLYEHQIFVNICFNCHCWWWNESIFTHLIYFFIACYCIVYYIHVVGTQGMYEYSILTWRSKPFSSRSMEFNEEFVRNRAFAININPFYIILIGRFFGKVYDSDSPNDIGFYAAPMVWQQDVLMY